MGEQQCPKCSRWMTNMGNVSGGVYCSYPPQWDEVHVCHSCRVKVSVRVVGKIAPDMPWMAEYEEVQRGK